MIAAYEIQDAIVSRVRCVKGIQIGSWDVRDVEACATRTANDEYFRKAQRN